MSMYEPRPGRMRLGEAQPGLSTPLIPVTDAETTVLICDDNAYMRTHLREMLEAEGLVVAGEATDGLEAVQLFDDLRPDAVIMDLVMPNLDGMGAIVKIIELDPDARIVVCSGLGSDAQVADAIEAGAVDFLVKPFQVERVVATVQAVLPGVVRLQGGGVSSE